MKLKFRGKMGIIKSRVGRQALLEQKRRAITLNGRRGKADWKRVKMSQKSQLELMFRALCVVEMYIRGCGRGNNNTSVKRHERYG